MKEYKEFTTALKKLREVYLFEKPYEDMVIAGIAAFYKVCAERARNLMKKILKDRGYPSGDIEYSRQMLRAAYRAGMIREEKMWLAALEAEKCNLWLEDSRAAEVFINDIKEQFCPLFCELEEELGMNWIK